MPVWWVVLLIQIGVAIAYELIRPKQKFDDPEPSGIGDFQFPTIGEGRVIPMVWGTVKIGGPMVAWYGDLDVVAVTKWVRTGWFSGEDVVVAHKYYLGMQLVLCSGEIDEVLELRFDDLTPGDQTIIASPDQPTEATRVTVDANKLFGGDEKDGGIKGDFDIYHGTASQDPDAYLEDKLSEDLPAWRGITYMVSRRAYLGTSPYIKDVSVVVRRCPNTLGLTGGDENIVGDANPAAMIYDIMTSSPSKNGLGLPAGNMDLTSFQEAGATLADEGLGLSMIQDKGTSAKDLIMEIMRHIDATLYVEPTTGLLVLRLIRHDYVEDDLPVLDQDSCDVSAYGRASWGEVKTQIRVTYIDRDDGWIQKSVQAQDLAAIEASGGEISTQTFNLYGYSNATNAQRAAARALAGLAYPIATMSIVANRLTWDLRPGSVFKLTWPTLGITEMICRVLKVNTGDLLSGQVSFEAAEDIFAVTWEGYTVPDSSYWDDPAGVVPSLVDQGAFLAPYAAIQSLPFPEGTQQAFVVAARGYPGITLGYNVWIDGEDHEVPIFTPSGTLQGAMTKTSTSFVLDAHRDCVRVESVNGPDFDAGLNLIVIQDGSGLEEIIAFQTSNYDEDNEEITISGLARGGCDTAPTPFAVNTRVWFTSYGTILQQINASGSTAMTFQPYNNNGALLIGSCDDTTISAISPQRRHRVYCPTDVQFNSASYPVSITGELTVSWEHRNRLGEWGYADSGVTATPEDGTEYALWIYGELDTLLRTVTGITAKTYTYLVADEIADSAPLGRLNNHLRVILKTSGDAGAALREIEWEFDRV